MAEKSQNDHSKLLAILLFVGAGTLILMSMGPEQTKKSGAPAAVKTEKFEKSVNKHLMYTNEKMDLERRRMEIENARLGGDFNSTKAQPTYEPQTSGVDLSTDSKAAEVANELGRGTRREEEATSPHDIIQKELFNAEQNAQYTQVYKEEYARQFIENARRGGYKVILDDQYRVKQVIPIRRPSEATSSNMQLFNTGGDQAQ